MDSPGSGDLTGIGSPASATTTSVAYSARGVNQPASPTPPSQPQITPATGLTAIPAAIIGLGKRVCRCFLDFLETDFKRQQAPRRKITGQSENGQITSIGLRKYPSFYKEIRKIADQPMRTGTSLTVKRQQHTIPLDPLLANLIEQYVKAIEPQLFKDAANTATKATPAGSVDAIREQAKSLADGTSKPCQRCQQIKPLKDFFDARLKGGEDGHGRVCMACKTPEQRTPTPFRHRSVTPGE